VAEKLALGTIFHEPHKCLVFLDMNPQPILSAVQPFSTYHKVGCVMSKVRRSILHAKIYLAVKSPMDALINVRGRVLKFRLDAVQISTVRDVNHNTGASL
jgi:hypothetical protein